MIDWHNLSHTIAAVRLGERHRAVKAIARSERRWARRADAHLDRVAGARRLAGARIQGQSRRLSTIGRAMPSSRPSPADGQRRCGSGSRADAQLGPSRPPIVVCPTSWTPDEDFDLLLEALERAERQLTRNARPAPATPALAVLLTGRGALRDAFEARAARRNFKAIAVKTVWLEPVGLSDARRHGRPRPLPSSVLVGPRSADEARRLSRRRCARRRCSTTRRCCREVMTSGQEGVTFRDPGDLANVLVTVATGSASRRIRRSARAARGSRQHPPERWSAQWDQAARPVLFP